MGRNISYGRRGIEWVGKRSILVQRQKRETFSCLQFVISWYGIEMQAFRRGRRANAFNGKKRAALE